MARADELSVIKLADRIQTEADAYAVLEELRWGGGEPVCPHCGAAKAYFLKPANGTSRKTRTGSNSERRVWKCASCRKQFSVLTGTIFHGTKISLRKWLFVVFEMCANKNGISAREIERRYDLTPKSAWFMTHRIREAMKREPMAGLLRGTIVADEAWIGGKAKNKHYAKRTGEQAYVPGTSIRQNEQTPVLSLVHRETGEVYSRVVPDVTGATLCSAIEATVDMGGSVLHTDSSSQYRSIGRHFAAHEAVNHHQGEYVLRSGASTNKAENFFSQLKRSIDGTHHHVSVEHLPRYLAEFDYRYNTRELNDTARMRRLMGQVAGRRLTYRPLTDR